MLVNEATQSLRGEPRGASILCHTTVTTTENHSQTCCQQKNTAGFRHELDRDCAIDDELTDVPTEATAADIRQVKAEVVIAVFENEAAVAASIVAASKE